MAQFIADLAEEGSNEVIEKSDLERFSRLTLFEADSSVGRKQGQAWLFRVRRKAKFFCYN